MIAQMVFGIKIAMATKGFSDILDISKKVKDIAGQANIKGRIFLKQ